MESDSGRHLVSEFLLDEEFGRVGRGRKKWEMGEHTPLECQNSLQDLKGIARAEPALPLGCCSQFTARLALKGKWPCHGSRGWQVSPGHGGARTESWLPDGDFSRTR